MVFGFSSFGGQDNRTSPRTKQKLKVRKTQAEKSRNRKLLFEGLEERRVMAGFTAGSIQGQDGWTGGTTAINPSVFQGVDQTGLNAHTGTGSWQISNNTTFGNINGAFTSWPFTPGLVAAAGQPSSGAPADRFTATYYFKSGSAVADGSNIEVDLGTVPGDDRNTFMAITNRADVDGGLQIRMSEPDGVTGNFYNTQIVSTGLSRTAWHRIDITAVFVNGNGNDTFQVSLDGNLLLNPNALSPNFNTPNFGTFEGYRNGLGSTYALSNRLFFRSGLVPSGWGAFADNASQGIFVDDLSYRVYNSSNPSATLGSYAAAFEAQPTNTYVDQAGDYTINFNGGAPGLDAGDIVTWNGPSPVSGLVFGTDAFTTIQGGVNGAAAGGNVYVAAGTYNEGVTVSKTVTLKGAQSGVDARTRVGAESIVNFAGGAFGLAADDITLDGFTLQGQTADNSGPGFGYAVYMGSGGTHTGAQVINNIVQNNHGGIGLANTGARQVLIQHNLFQNNTSGTLATDIYGDQFVAGGAASNVLIDANKFTNTAPVQNSWAFGISNTAATPFTNLTFSNNNVTNHGRGAYFYNTSNSTVTGNTFTGTGRYGVGLFGINGTPANSSISISANTFSPGGTGGAGIEIVDDSSAAAYSGTLVLGGNTFTTSGSDNSIRNLSASPVTATSETFNTVLASTATLAQQFTIVDTIVDGVDVPGFGLVRTKAGNVYVTTNSFSTANGTNAAAIQRGVNVATSGDTVNVAAGTFAGAVTINKDLTLDGADSANSTLNGGASPVISVSGATTITLKDLSLTGSASALGNSGVTSLTLDNVSSSLTSSWTGTTGTVNLKTKAGANDSASATGTSFGVSSGNVLGTVSYAANGVTNLNIDTRDGDDTISVTAPAVGGTLISVDGNSNGAPGDTLIYDATGASITINPASITSATRQTVNYTNIENLQIANAIIQGTAAADTFVVSFVSASPYRIQYVLNGGTPVVITNPVSLTFNGSGGDDVMTVDLSTGDAIPSGGLFFNGETHDFTIGAPTPNHGDVLKVVGNGANAEYRALGTPGAVDKNLDVNTTYGLISATGVEPGDLSGFATVDVVFSGADEALAINNGFDATSGAIPALVVTGFTGVNSFEGAHLWNNTTVRILTANTSIGGTDGNDSVTISGGSNAHGNANLVIDTGSGTDTVTVAGNLTVTGDIQINSQNMSFTGGTLSAVNVDLNAGTGAISTTTTATDISATNLLVTATTGIDLDTTVANITINNSGAGSVNIDETDALNLLNATVSNGNLTITANGALTDANNALTSVSGNASLSATSILLGDTGTDSVNFGSVTFTSLGNVTITENSSTDLAGSSTGAAVSLTTTASINDGASTNDIAASVSLALSAVTGIGSGGAIETTTPAVEATTGSGGVFLANAGNLQIGGVNGIAGVNAVSGNIVVTTTGSLKNIEGVKNTNGDITLSTIDAGGTGQDITVAAAIEATVGQVTFNAGDDLFVTSTVKAGTTVTGNVDVGTVDASGGVFTLSGSVGSPVAITAPNGTFLKGNTNNDTFNIYAQTTTAFNVDGDLPVGTLTGDILAMSVVGTGATLTVGGTAPYNGAGSGTWTFAPSLQSIRFKSIEDSQIIGSYHLTYDFANSVPTTTDLFVMRDNTFAKLQLRDGSNVGQILFQANLAPNLAGNGVLSLKVLGTGNNESVTVDDVNTLPVFVAAVPGTPDNLILGGQASLLFQGAGGVNKLNFALVGANINQSYAIGNGSGVGSEGEVQTVAGAGTLTSYFTGLGPAGSVNRTGGNANPGSLTILGDDLDNTINVSAAGAITNIDPVSYTPFNFSALGSSSYGDISLFGLDGNDKLNMQGFGNTVANDPTITLSGGNNDDTLQVGDTSGNSGLISIFGGSGNDTVVLTSDSLSTSNANRTDQIRGQVAIDGGPSLANDQLFLVALANTAALTNVQITSTTIDNVTNYAAGPDVTFNNINLLDVTTTNLADTITTTLTAPSFNNDLAVVNVRGGNANDQFYLHIPATPTNTPAGLTNINLFGNDGDDTFGSSTDKIIPAYSKASGADIFINGGTPDVPNFDPVTKNSNDGDKTFGDRIYLDMSSATAPVIVDTVTGIADSASHRRLVYNGIEDIDLYDNAGQLQNVHQGALYMRATEASDYIVLMGLNGGKVRIRVNNAYYGDYAPVTKLMVHARAGNDYIATSVMPANLPLELYGDEGDDSITGSAAGDLIVGGEGLDRLSGGAGGVDEIWGDVFNPITADPNLDIMLDPTNVLAVGIRAAQVDKSIYNSLGGAAANPSTDGNDIITTAPGNGADRIYGQGANDIVTASAQDDVIYGGDGIDNLNGANGNDRIYGGAGNDNLAGEGGNDFLYGGTGNDTLNGGLGTDVLVGGTGQDTLRGDQERDLLVGGSVTYSGSTADSKAYSDVFDNAMLLLLNNWSAAVAPSIPFSGLTVTNDGEIDSLTGGEGADDFYNEAVDLMIDYLVAQGDRKTF